MIQLARYFGKLAYHVDQFAGARSAPIVHQTEEDEKEGKDPLDDLLKDVLNPCCRMCRLCERRGDGNPMLPGCLYVSDVDITRCCMEYAVRL